MTCPYGDHTLTPADVIRDVSAAVERGEWCGEKRGAAFDELGRECAAWSSKAFRWTLLGLFNRHPAPDAVKLQAMGRVRVFMPRHLDWHTFNESATVGDVLKLLKEAKL